MTLYELAAHQADFAMQAAPHHATQGSAQIRLTFTTLSYKRKQPLLVSNVQVLDPTIIATSAKLS
jgi:hypothetical protein